MLENILKLFTLSGCLTAGCLGAIIKIVFRLAIVAGVVLVVIWLYNQLF
jgi:hypothetical protein